ncbi:unnamed protein product [Parajaminaea phylloscopi]
MVGIVDYDSASDDGDVKAGSAEPSDLHGRAVIESPFAFKRRRLHSSQDLKHSSPTKELRDLRSSSVITPTTGTNVSATLHEANVVPGEWLAFVWFRVPSDHPPLAKLLRRVCSRVKRSSWANRFQPVIANERADFNLSDIATQREAELTSDLHISITKPLLIRAQEREALHDEVRKTLDKLSSDPRPRHSSGVATSFARFTVLPSTSTPRAFLAFEVGKGYEELLRCSQALNDTLKTCFRAPEYWKEGEVRFHASFGAFDMRPPPEDAMSAGEQETWSKIKESELQALADLIEERYGDDLRRSVGELRLTKIGVTVGKSTRWLEAPAL